MSKKVKSTLIICFIGFLIVMPLIISIGVSLPILENVVVDNDWIGFWGSYMGSVLGGIITLYVLWNTIRSSEQARQRDEKIQFFDKVVELYSQLNASEGNVFALATRVISTYDGELYRLYLQQVNYSAGLGSELGIFLASRRQLYNFQEFESCFLDITYKINEFTIKFDDELLNEFKDEDRVNELENNMDEILNEMMVINKTLAICIEDNIKES